MPLAIRKFDGAMTPLPKYELNFFVLLCSGCALQRMDKLLTLCYSLMYDEELYTLMPCFQLLHICLSFAFTSVIKVLFYVMVYMMDST